MKSKLMVVILTAFAMPPLLADPFQPYPSTPNGYYYPLPEPNNLNFAAAPTANNPIEAQTATGEREFTVIDQGGNLKMIENPKKTTQTVPTGPGPAIMPGTITGPGPGMTGVPMTGPPGVAGAPMTAPPPGMVPGAPITAPPGMVPGAPITAPPGMVPGAPITAPPGMVPGAPITAPPGIVPGAPMTGPSGITGAPVTTGAPTMSPSEMVTPPTQLNLPDSHGVVIPQQRSY